MNTANKETIHPEQEAWPRIVDGKLTFPESLQEHFPSIVMRLETLDSYAVENGLARGESIKLLRIFLVIESPTEECLASKIDNGGKAAAFFAALNHLFASDELRVG